MPEWPLPLARRNHSSAVRPNVPHADDSMHMMDNHHADMRCRMRHRAPDMQAGPVHVGWHTAPLFSEGCRVQTLSAENKTPLEQGNGTTPALCRGSGHCGGGTSGTHMAGIACETLEIYFRRPNA